MHIPTARVMTEQDAHEQIARGADPSEYVYGTPQAIASLSRVVKAKRRAKAKRAKASRKANR